MDLTQVIEFLRDNGYIKTTNGKLVFTKKFHEDHATQRGVINTGSPNALVIISPGVDSDLFIRFILDSKVPSRLETKTGPYFANKYSTDAAKEFSKILTKGYNYELLVKSTMLYYKSGVGYKKAISNYILQGDWLTGYEELKAAADTGENELKEHIKQTLDNGEHNNFTF